ncbi:NifU family protein [Rhodococcoides yunnanense]|uniref:NifU family protein n=1 Tax=Rhodococcoides yunnanense TaxID=278209 RepID=UPI000932FFF7|nr:NifU family protein [Rhodococcus yunnanensis]
MSEDAWRSAGERIDTLVDSIGVGGAVARERAEQLVREVVDLYGEGLARILRMSDAAAVERLVHDDLVASLLLVHDIHPHDTRTRIRTALDGVRPYLGSHGGDVELIDVVDSVVQLRLTGSCKTCPSSSVTLELAVTDAVRSAAPETTGIEVETPAAEDKSLFSPESLMSRVHTTAGGSAPEHTWVSMPELDELADGSVGGFEVAGLPILVCRLGTTLYAYRDRCAHCTETMAGARLGRVAATNSVALTCPICHSHYDVRAAGAALDHSEHHLDPLPILVRGGVPSVATPIGSPS